MRPIKMLLARHRTNSIGARVTLSNGVREVRRIFLSVDWPQIVRIDATEDGSPADPGLSERGYLQAQRVLDALAQDEITHLYVAPAHHRQGHGSELLTAAQATYLSSWQA